MASRELKITRIGNSRGVRIPADTLERYAIGECVIMEERGDGILLRPVGGPPAKLSWSETAREMAAAREDWSAWDTSLADGLETVPWVEPEPKRVAEPKQQVRSAKRRSKRKQ